MMAASYRVVFTVIFKRGYFFPFSQYEMVISSPSRRTNLTKRLRYLHCNVDLHLRSIKLFVYVQARDLLSFQCPPPPHPDKYVQKRLHFKLAIS